MTNALCVYNVSFCKYGLQNRDKYCIYKAKYGHESWLKRKKSRYEKDIRKIDRTHDIYPKSRLPSDTCLPGG